jgi:hypothetical protein
MIERNQNRLSDELLFCVHRFFHEIQTQKLHLYLNLSQFILLREIF